MSGTDCYPLIEIHSGKEVVSVAFSYDGKYLFSGHKDRIQAWRVEDGSERASATVVGFAWCLAVSKDGRWVAVGTLDGYVTRLDAERFSETVSLKKSSKGHKSIVNGLDFSPDSTRLLVAADNTAIVYHVSTRKPILGPLHHRNAVVGAKYSPEGDRIATATRNSIKVYNSNNGSLLQNISAKASFRHNAGLLWSHDQLFVVSKSKIKQVEASTGSITSEWSASDTDLTPCIVLPRHRRFIAYAVKRTVTFWDMPARSEPSCFQSSQPISSIALSPDDQFLALAREEGEITISCLPHITTPVPSPRLHTPIQTSANHNVHDRSHSCIDQGRTEAVIHMAIENAIRKSPRVLINTHNGLLYGKAEQRSYFKSCPVFAELVSSMTASIDQARIDQEVEDCYRYAMFSHKWQVNEPLFEKVKKVGAYALEDSPTHHKLQMFLKIARDAGFHWAWSDTCCINKTDSRVLQEALIAMFKWYQGATMTIVFLYDVLSPSRRGDLMKSAWNTRAWTLQEYHASKVVRFYAQDWTPYLNLTISNHKESHKIIEEMEKATGVPAQGLKALRPGLNDIGDKLRLASTRETERIEDAAYSLLGIFSLSLPIMYGEGNRALGRLLAELLASSRDTVVLAWRGKAGNFNSCLPASIAVFKEPPTAYIPPAITGAEMDIAVSRLDASASNLARTVRLYDRVKKLPGPSFTGQRRMILPCIVFKLGPLLASGTGNHNHVFRARTTALGVVEIETKEDLSRLDSLYLVHPWINYLLDEGPQRDAMAPLLEDDRRSLSSYLSSSSRISDRVRQWTQTQVVERAVRFMRLPSGRARTISEDASSLRSPSYSSSADKHTHMQARQFVVRLQQRFGALLLARSGRSVATYRRVATESMITVRVKDLTPRVMNQLVDSVRKLEVL